MLGVAIHHYQIHNKKKSEKLFDLNNEQNEKFDILIMMVSIHFTSDVVLNPIEE